MAQAIVFVPNIEGEEDYEKFVQQYQLPEDLVEGVYIAFNQYTDTGLFVSCNYVDGRPQSCIDKDLGLVGGAYKAFIIDKGWIKKCKFHKGKKILVLHEFVDRSNNDAGADMDAKTLVSCHTSAIYQRSRTYTIPQLEWAPVESHLVKTDETVKQKLIDFENVYNDVKGIGNPFQVVEWQRVGTMYIVGYSCVTWIDDDKVYEFECGGKMYLWNVSKRAIRYNGKTILPGEAADVGDVDEYKAGGGYEVLDSSLFLYH